MAAFIGFFLLSLSLLLKVQSTATSLNQVVYWNDSRILYSSERAALSGVDWEIYNMTTGTMAGESRTVASWICNGGAMNMWTKDDSATLIFNGTSVTVNFLAYYTGIPDIIVLVDGVPWTTLNTTDARMIDLPPELVTGVVADCITPSVTKSGLSNGLHNVTVVIPSSDPLRTYWKLFASFEYTARQEDVASTSSKVAPGSVIGGTLVGLFGIFNITVLVWFFLRRRRNTRTLGIESLRHSDNAHSVHSLEPYQGLSLASLPELSEKARLQSTLVDTSIVDLRGASAPGNREPIGNGRPNDGGESSRLAVIQELLDRGVPSSEIATVIQRMQEEAGSALPVTSRDETRTASPPPEYNAREKSRLVR
ncbi:hypothetical protein FRB95_001582 [Tulasnella sp. JGI-2019a]|nr:hypothetical protein FRB95_001582 [Tulasnella sp. JGI-2019a]